MTSRKTTVSSQSYKSSHPENLQSTSLASSSDFMQFTRSHSSSPATRDRSLNLRKIEVIELQQQSPSCDQYFGKTMFIWVPNLQKKRKWQKKHAQSIMQPQCVSVKEICFQGQPYDELHGLSVEQKQRQKMRKRAKKKTATGGQPYTYFARKQQSLKGRKDIMQPLYEEHRNELPEVAKGILTQPDHSDCVSEQGLMQQYSPAKSQPRLNCCEYQDARKIPGHAMPIPVSKKVPLHHLTEKQRQGQSTWRFRSSWKMDGQSLKTKGLDINNLNLKKCLVNNLSVLQEHISSDQDSVHPPSSVHSTNDECAQPCSDASGMLAVKSDVKDTPLYTVDSRFLSNLQLTLLMGLPGFQGTGSSILTASTYSQKSGLLTVSTAEIQNARWIKEQKVTAATNMRLSTMEQEGPEDQISSPGDKQREQKDVSTATEMGPLTITQVGSEDQTRFPIAKQKEQQSLSTATELGPPVVKQTDPEDQSSNLIDLQDQKQDLSTATEEEMEQGDSKDQCSSPTVERDELQELNRTDAEDQSSFTVAGMSEKEHLNAGTAIKFPDQGVKDQGDFLITERTEQQDFGATTESITLIWDQRSEDPQNGITTTKDIEGQNLAAPTEILSSRDESGRTDI
ncbi:DNA polymerase epsilon subunit 3 isoform X3 [Narcine bancroftii]